MARFIEEGFNCSNANKSVLSGIEAVASLMKQGHFYVSRDGIPEKTQNDDVMDAIRYAIYTQHHQMVTISAIKD